MKQSKKQLTDFQRDAIYDLLQKEFPVTYIAEQFNCSRQNIYNFWAACETFESRNPERIEAYRNSSNFIMANWNWAKAKFGAVSMFDDEANPEEYGSATAIEVLINQQRDILIELARIRKLLEEGQ